MNVRICAKCSDMFTADLVVGTGNKIGSYDGYVPDWMPGEHYGDYIILDIDVKTGKIKNWKKPAESTVRKTFLKRN
jgi:hypothetical protein